MSPHIKNLQPKKKPLFPVIISSHSVAGKSHFYNNNEVVVNEDICGTFEFNCRTDYINKSSEFPTDFDDIVTGIFLADGHGENRNVPKDSSKWAGSGGERFVALVKHNVTDVLKSIFQMANYGVKRDLEMEKRYKYFYRYSKEEEEKKLENSFLKHLREGMKNFHRMMDQALCDEDSTLCNDNGSTICICLTWRNYLFCINIGDSNIMIFDPVTGKALKVWKRPQKDDMYHVCSYDDTLASYPDYLHEGQTLFAVRQDYNFVGEYCKQFATLRGRYFYSLTSPSSIYGLSLTNTLGNKNHIGRTLCRTSVYEFNIPELLEKTEGHRFSIICVTDGIKDVLDSTEIGSFHLNFQNGINEKYEKIMEEVEKERKRKEIYRKYEMSYGSVKEVKSKSMNNLIGVPDIDNNLKEVEVDSELVHNMDLLDIKNKLKRIVNGYNKDNPLDIFDTNSLNIILKTFINHNIKSYQTSDYYTYITSSSSATTIPNGNSITTTAPNGNSTTITTTPIENSPTNTTPVEVSPTTSTPISSTSTSPIENNNDLSHFKTSSLPSYYPEFLTCLTNFAALCQTLDDCTAINMEISGIVSNIKNEESQQDNNNSNDAIGN